MPSSSVRSSRRSASGSTSPFPQTQYEPAAPGEDSQEYVVNTLLAEDAIRNQYLVDWEGINPETGYRFKPSWEPKHACTDDLIQEWKQKLKAKEVVKGRKRGENILKEWEKEYRKAMNKLRAKKDEEKRKAQKEKDRRIEAAESSDEEEDEELVVAGPSSTKESTQPQTIEDPADKTYEDDDDGMEILEDSDGEAQRKKGKAENESAGNGKRKRAGGKENTDEPSGKKRRPRASTRETSTAASVVSEAAPKAPKRKPRKSHSDLPLGKSPPPQPRTTRSRSRSTSIAPLNAGANIAGGSKSKSTAPVAKPVPKKAIGAKKTAHFAPSSDPGIELLSDDEPVLQPEEFGGDFDFGDDPPPRSLSPDGQHVARLNAVIRNIPTTQAEGSPLPEEDIEEAIREVAAIEAEEAAARPTKSKSKSGVNATAGSSKSKSKKDLQAVVPPSTQTFRNAARLSAGNTNATQESDIGQFSSPPEPLGTNSKSKNGQVGNGRPDPGTVEDRQQGGRVPEPLFMPGGSDEGDQDDDRDISFLDHVDDNPMVDENMDDDDDGGGFVITGLPDGIEKVLVNDKWVIRAVEDDSSDQASPPRMEQASPMDDEDMAQPRTQMTDRGSSAAPLPRAKTPVVIPPPPPPRAVMLDRAISAEPRAKTPVLITPPRAVMFDRAISAEPQPTIVVTTVTESMAVTQTTSSNGPEAESSSGPSMTQLLADIAELRSINAELADRNTSISTENTTLRSRLATSPNLDNDNADLRAELETETNDLRAKVKTLSSDLAFHKNLYDTASTRAVENADLSRELQAKLKIKEGQLVTGLKQKDLHSTAVRARDQQLISTLQAQNKLLLDQARKTDDALRAKAVMYPRVKKENEDLLAINAELEGRVENLSKRNEQLVDQVQGLRARQMGILQGNENDEEEDEGSETDTGSYMSDESGGTGQDMEGMGYATRPVDMTSSGEYYESADLEVGDVLVKTEREDEGEVTDGQGLAYECQYRNMEGDKMCGQLLATRGVLQNHWISVHREDIQPMSQ